jgi:CRISPR-associated endonuclease/helicase Cas3
MPSVDVTFAVNGGPIPADHGYILFSSLYSILPSIHSDSEIGIFPINGTLTGDRRLSLTNESKLTIRLPVERVGEILGVVGKRLVVGDGVLQIGVPNARALMPAVRLYSRLVVIKGFTNPNTFLEAAQRQLAALNVKAKPLLVEQKPIAEINREAHRGTRSPFLRRTLKIHDKNIVGFALQVDGLTDDESLLLQEKGVGGRRRFGCGLFVVDRR